MPKDISTLTEDIYNVLDSTEEHDPSAKLAADYAMRIGGELAKSTLKRDKPRELGKLWASDIGKKCLRQLWYKFNMEGASAPLMGHTKFKFLYGNILEEAVLYMAEEAGHTVEHQQERVEYKINSDWQVSGRIDAVIDGVLVDVKTTSSYGYKKYSTEGITPDNDSFGYIQQLGYYGNHGSFKQDGEGFVWIDKQNGHIKYTPCVIDTEVQLLSRYDEIVKAIEKPSSDDVPMPHTHIPEAYGKSGNMKLSIGCTYCDFKKECWKDANGGKGLRTFLYGHGPVDFTIIRNEPRVLEILGDDK